MSEGSDAHREARIAAAIEAVHPDRLPVIVELSGMPKLGKTQFADALTGLLRRCTERVAEAPHARVEFAVRDRWRADFTAWALAAFVKRFLELKEWGCQVIVADRGLFDAMAWLRVKTELGKCDERTVSDLRGLAYSPLWWQHYAVVLVFLSSDEQVLHHALARRLYHGESVVTTSPNLQRLRRALHAEAELCNRQRDLIRVLDVGGIPLSEVLQQATEKVLLSLEEYADLR